MSGEKASYLCNDECKRDKPYLGRKYTGLDRRQRNRVILTPNLVACDGELSRNMLSNSIGDHMASP